MSSPEHFSISAWPIGYATDAAPRNKTQIVQRHEPGRCCEICSKPLSTYNAYSTCFACPTLDHEADQRADRVHHEQKAKR